MPPPIDNVDVRTKIAMRQTAIVSRRIPLTKTSHEVYAEDPQSVGPGLVSLVANKPANSYSIQHVEFYMYPVCKTKLEAFQMC